ELRGERFTSSSRGLNQPLTHACLTHAQDPHRKSTEGGTCTKAYFAPRAGRSRASDSSLQSPRVSERRPRRPAPAPLARFIRVKRQARKARRRAISATGFST